MSDYESIRGTRVKYLTSDPTLDSSTEGQVWYNSTTGANKSLVQFKAWSSGGDLATPRRYLAGCGTQTLALAFGGLNPGSNLNSTEEYNGFTWVPGGNLTTAVGRNAGAGTQTAGLSFGGQSTTITNQTEEYDGSSWTTGGAMNTGRSLLAGAGLQTAGLAFGGNEPALSNKTEEYDGSSWTASGTLNTARKILAGCGTQTAGLAFGGTPGSGNLADTEEYNGSSWTASNDLNTAGHGLAGAGTQDNALAFAGSGRPTATEEYDGTNWSTSSATLANGRQLLGGAGTRAAGLGFGGYGVPFGAKTEEYNSTIDTFTAAAWSSGGNLPSAKRTMGSSKGGNINSSLFFGGDNLPMGAGQPQVNTTEEYNGTSWSGGGNVGNPVSGTTGAGTQTAMIGATGYSTGSPWQTAGAAYIANAFEYDGSSWSNVTAVPTTGVGLNSFGTQTASVFGGGAQGGSPGPEASNRSTTYHEYNGTSWTSGGSSNNVHGRTQSAAGVLTAGIVFAGVDPTGRGDSLETYNGTTWTEESNGLFEGAGMGGFGTQTNFVAAGGAIAPIPSSPGTTGYNTATVNWNGTAMTATATTATNHMYTAGDGTSGTTSGFIGGGSSAYASNTTSTEEYTEATAPVATASTLTTS
jgi:hypothetical protein